MNSVTGLTREIWDFIIKQNIIGSSLGIIIGNYVRDFSNAMSEGIIKPIIKKIQGRKEGDEIKEITFSLFGIEFRFDELINVFINMMVILSIFFAIQVIIPKNIITRFTTGTGSL